MKRRKPLTMLTAYDAPTAQLLAEAGVDYLLVGDSVGMVLLGYSSTKPVTMEEMLHHAKAVRRGAPKAFVIGDMPYEGVRYGVKKAVLNARRFLREAGCDAVKLEWRKDAPEIVKALVRAKIPAMGHLGLLPQSASTFKVQAKLAKEAVVLYRHAKLLEKLGAFGVLLECVPENVSKAVTKALKIPTFGIGAGPHCDGQVLVIADVVGAFRKFRPKFVKRYGNADALTRGAVKRYVADVRSRRFPADRHSFHMDAAEQKRFEALIR